MWKESEAGMERITSLQNAKVKKWAGLHQKKERDKGLVPSQNSLDAPKILRLIFICLSFQWENDTRKCDNNTSILVQQIKQL